MRPQEAFGVRPRVDVCVHGWTRLGRKPRPGCVPAWTQGVLDARLDAQAFSQWLKYHFMDDGITT
eukprot:1140700-Pelagomonas_calceolata.AAC.4